MENWEPPGFRHIWQQLAREGACDESIGSEYHRVRTLWTQWGHMAALAAFIREKANHPPSPPAVAITETGGGGGGGAATGPATGSAGASTRMRVEGLLSEDEIMVLLSALVLVPVSAGYAGRRIWSIVGKLGLSGTLRRALERQREKFGKCAAVAHMEELADDDPSAD